MQRSFWAAVVACTLVLSPTASARAVTIDTTGSDTGTIVQFGAPDTATYGQTFTAPGSVLNSFSLFLRNRFTGSDPWICAATSPGGMASWRRASCTKAARGR